MALGNIIPTYQSDWVFNGLSYLNNIQTAGVVQLINAPSITKGDTHWRNPKVKSLNELAANDIQMTTSSTLTPQALTDYTEIFPVLHRQDGITVRDFNNIEAGVDFGAGVLNQIPGRVLNQTQIMIAAMLKGIYITSGALNTSHVYDMTGYAMTPMMVYDAAESKLGEADQLLNKVIMHSKVKIKLAGQIENKVTTQVNGGTLVTSWLGDKQVIVNNTICATLGDNVYPTYICGGSPILMGWQKNINLESQRTITTKSTAWSWDYHYAVGMSGVTYAGAANPASTVLDDAASWTSTAPTANSVLCVQLLTTEA
jgi:hypothetical protein